MKYISVFCVVLYYVHTSVALPYQNNAQDVFNVPTSTKNNNFPILDEASPYSSNEFPRQEVLESLPNIQARDKDPLLRTKGITLRRQELPSKWDEKGSLFDQNPTESILTHTLQHNLENGQNEGLQNEKFVSNQRNLFENLSVTKNTYENLKSNSKVVYDHQNQPTIKHQPLKPEADISLDLQGISLENINSLIGQSLFGSPTEPELPTKTDLILDKDNSIRYIIKKAKQMHDINKHNKKLKRYTIIHPDGTVDSSDDLEKVSGNYPNYIIMKYSDLSKYDTNASATATGLKSRKINQEGNGKIIPKMPNNVNIDLKQSDAASPIIPPKTTLAPKVINNDKNKVHQSFYIKNNVTTDIVSEKNLNKTVQNESIVPHTVNRSEIVSNEDFAIATTTTTIPQNDSVANKDIALENRAPGLSNSGPFLKGNNSQLAVNVSQDVFNTPSSPPSSPSPCDEDIDYSGIWYQDKDFWDQLKNNAHYNLLFFMFVPTAPQVRKETKTIIYPNGTTVEEIIEIVDGKDGFPEATKTTKVTLVEDTDANEKKLSQL